MRSLKRKRRITPRSKRVVTTGARHRGKEDDMLPGISDTECRIAELRYRDLHANAERQRIAAHASAPESDRLRPSRENGNYRDHDHGEDDRGDEERRGGRGPAQERPIRSRPLFGWGVGKIEGVVADRVDPDGVLADRRATAGSWLSHRSLLSFRYPQG